MYWNNAKELQITCLSHFLLYSKLNVDKTNLLGFQELFLSTLHFFLLSLKFICVDVHYHNYHYFTSNDNIVHILPQCSDFI